MPHLLQRPQNESQKSLYLCGFLTFHSMLRKQCICHTLCPISIEIVFGISNSRSVQFFLKHTVLLFDKVYNNQ